MQRWLKFVKYLREFGIEPVVYVPKDPHYPLLDPSLEAEVPSDIKVIRRSIFEPYGFAKIFSKKQTKEISSGIIPEEGKQGLLQKLMLFIRGNFFIPDARKFWIRPSVRFLKQFLQEEDISAVITTGPPHSVHLIGLKLKQQLNIKWMADFRDPWTSIGYHDKLKLTARSARKHKRLEKQVLDSADQLLTTSFVTKEEFEALSPTPVKVITNGYDREKITQVAADEKFSLAHIGSLLSGRNPEDLWQALHELTAENADFAKDFQLKLVGAVGQAVLRSIKGAGLEPFLELKGYVSHTEALQLQRSAQMLLLIEIDSEQTRGIIPGKLFEYMVTNRPVVAVGPEGSDVERILKETNTGRYFGYSEKKAIKDHILQAYQQFRNNELQSHPIGLQRYSRRSLTGELAALIKKTAG